MAVVLQKTKPRLRLIEPDSRLLLANNFGGLDVEIRLSLKKENEPPERIISKFLYEICRV